MAAPTGNQFWKQRSKHGKDALFASPSLFWTEACRYFDWCDKNPLIAIEHNGKDARECKVPKMRAYTQTGLCLYLGLHGGYFKELRERVQKKKDPLSKEFAEVIAQIEAVIFTQKFEGAAAGFLNANLITRDLGLADKQQVESNNKTSFTGRLEGSVRSSGVPIANSENDVQTRK